MTAQPTFQLAIEATSSHKSWQIIVQFGTGMKIRAALNDIEEIATALDRATHGDSTTVRGNEDWTLTVALINGVVVIDKRSSEPSDSAQLTPVDATRLAAELREQEQKAWATLNK